MSCDMWFGTKDYAQFIRTPQTGADVSPQAWGSSGTLLNGSGYAFNSFNSHKEYSFSWGASAAREAAQTMKSYFDGSFGRGKLHFVDPLTYSTNVLPARWADPSITADFEGPQLVPGVDPYTVPTSNFQWLRLPVRTAVFDLDSVQPVANTVFLPEAENLFTNPRLKGDGTWAEVRRNKLPASIPSTAWQVQSGTSGVVTTDPNYLASGFRGYYCRWDTVPTGGNVSIFPANNSGSIVTVTPGEVIPISVKAISQRPKVRLFAEWYTSGGSWIAVAANSGYVTVTNDPANPTLISVVTDEAPATAGRLYVRVMPSTSDMLAGDRIVVGEVMVGHGNYFNGSTTPETVEGVDQPEDFRWRWLGDENASESVMEIETVAGLMGLNAIAGVSTFEGKPAVRVILTANGGFAYISPPVILRPNPSTAMGTLNLRETHGAISTTYARTLLARSPDTATPQAPDEPGPHPLKLSLPPMPSLSQVRLYNGGVYGESTDVWWTDIGLFAGDYQGPWFSGDTEIPGKVTRWTGAPNNSTSQIGVLQSVSTPNINEENSVFVPIPDGMQLNVGAFYSGSPEAGVYVVNATQGGSPGMNITRLQPLTPSDTNILPNVFTKAPGDIGVYIIFGKLDSVDALLNVTAIHARLSPIGVNPQGENYWLGGQGNEGVRFVQPPTYINHTGVNGGQVEFAATFKESIH